MNACDFGSLCDTIRIWKQGSGFRDFVREKNYYSWYFQALNIDICESGIVSMGEEKYYLYADLANSDISASDISSLNGNCILVGIEK